MQTRRIWTGNTGIAANYALHVDDDGDFTSGNTTNYTATSISGDTIYDKNLVNNSKNVDVLFHESMSLDLVNLLNKNAKRMANFFIDIDKF